jgi:hypothetical protein
VWYTKREHQGKPKTERKSMALTATAAEIKKDEPEEDKAFNAYVEAQKPSLYQDYVAKRHEERGERQRQLKELARQSSECPIILDSDSDDDAQTVQDQCEPMEVANTRQTVSVYPNSSRVRRRRQWSQRHRYHQASQKPACH